MIETLLGIRPWRAALFDSPAEAERAMEVAKKFNREAVQRYYLLQSRLHYLLGEFHQALDMARQSEQWTDRRVGQYNAYELDFVHALSIAAVYPTAEPEQKAGLWESLQHKVGILAGLVEAGAGPNFRHQYLLLTAEVARIHEDHRTASTTYERAIACAADSGLIHEQALANEVAARFYLGQGLERVARVYLEEARYCYEKWGATAKAKHLEQHYPDLFVRGARPDNAPLRVTRTSSSQSEILDVATVIKASQVISSEMMLGALLQKLLGSIIENTGAQRGFLVLRHRGKLSVEAAGSAESDEVTLIDSEPLGQSDRLSLGIVQYVARTRQDVVLDDAAREGMFQTDPYITEKQPRSVLCTPLINQGRLVGVTYLENNLACGAFTKGRLQVVNLLGAQAAISIENARLFSELEQSNRKLTGYSRTLEQKVEERTRDLADRNEQLNASLKKQRQMQDQLLISEKMASLGNLVAGVAHEINNPVGAVASSADTAQRVQDKLEQALEGARSIQELRGSDRFKQLLSILRENHDVMGTASQRVTRIVGTLRSFARLDEAELKLADLHEGLESTLTLVRHRLKEAITVQKEYGQLEPIYCYPNQLNQVFMNLLINAVDAIEEGSNVQRQITIRTWMEQDRAHVQIADTGAGVPEQMQSKIFDPGFTTKGVGVGTGLGLPICFNIVQKHKGSLSFESEPGRGTTFTISLPVGSPS
jgi:signal transduction histidine kinase